MCSQCFLFNSPAALLQYLSTVRSSSFISVKGKLADFQPYLFFTPVSWVTKGLTSVVILLDCEAKNGKWKDPLRRIFDSILADLDNRPL